MGPKGLIGSLLFASLVIGTATGVVIDRTILQHLGPGHRHGHGGPRDHDGLPPHFREELDLDDQQAAKIKDIFDQRRHLFDEAMKDARPKLEKLQDETDQQIRAVLRPEQQGRLEELHRRWRRAHRWSDGGDDKQNMQQAGSTISAPTSGHEANGTDAIHSASATGDRGPVDPVRKEGER